MINDEEPREELLTLNKQDSRKKTDSMLIAGWHLYMSLLNLKTAITLHELLNTFKRLFLYYGLCHGFKAGAMYLELLYRPDTAYTYLP